MANVSAITAIHNLCPALYDFPSNITIGDLLNREECFGSKINFLEIIKAGEAELTTSAISYFQELTKMNAGYIEDALQQEMMGDDSLAPMPIRLLMTMVFSLLSIIGVVGNLLVIAVVFKVQGMITPTNCYLCSLAISDCLFFLCTAPTELSYIHTDNFIFGSIGCSLSTYLPFLAINTSSLSIAAFTIERYIGICHPIRARYICTVKRAKHIILGIWLFCIVYNSPWLYLASIQTDVVGVTCSFSLARDNWMYKVMFLGDFFGFYVLPMLLYFIIYGKIAFTLSQNSIKTSFVKTSIIKSSVVNKEKKKSTGSTDLIKKLVVAPLSTEEPVTSCKHSGGKSNQVIKMLALVVLVFAVCWLPYRAMVMYNSFSSEKWSPEWFIFFAKTMIFMNCAINPILYNHMSKKFRNAFRKFFSSSSLFTCFNLESQKLCTNGYGTKNYSMYYDKIRESHHENVHPLLGKLNKKATSELIKIVIENSEDTFDLTSKGMTCETVLSTQRLISGSSTCTNESTLS
uniref:Thyrotropin-releasing hormone receptor n=1 Tax=Rhabditophanes sp. KR3021 TaxID=114890 RepID=A0AC35UEI4_9BILA